MTTQYGRGIRRREMRSVKEQNWDNIYNEGGDGFNPYRAHREPAQPKWIGLSDKIYHLQRIMAGTSTSDPAYDKLEAELAETRKQYDAEKIKEVS